MPRTPSIIPKRSWQVRLPEDLAARVLAELHSEVEGCVPYGRWSQFIEARIREYYSRQDLNSPVKTHVDPQSGNIIHEHPSFITGRAEHRYGVWCKECACIIPSGDAL